ncbi:MAG: pyuvate ferredoxin oxidoreductase subunit delta [Firmicutes bacterium ADurb.Bin193]|nr:MAG: pyuvate ferredoxin oxidoreductase subunit delta [Firmicutes bacterium ADurb.Bin193]
MVRKIISINKEKCNGCGLCIGACHEGALRIVDGKAELISESYCDGLGNCLPECPTGAIEIIEREAEPFDEAAVNARMAGSHSGCPSTVAKSLENKNEQKPKEEEAERASQLMQWPVQIKLVPPVAPFFKGAKLLIAADCTAYAHPNIHKYMRNKVTLIGCPKLDEVDYSEKLDGYIKV